MALLSGSVLDNAVSVTDIRELQHSKEFVVIEFINLVENDDERVDGGFQEKFSSDIPVVRRSDPDT